MIFFTADLHFGHKGIREYCKRPWESNDEMREGLIRNWNAVVSESDSVFVLGDFSFGGAGYTADIVKRLNGHKTLIMGNHDGYRPDRYVGWGFDYATKEATEMLLTDGTKVLLSHYPYPGNHVEDTRYLERRPKDEGLWLLHGHIHQEWRDRPDMRSINVGVDVWDWCPVYETVISTMIHKGKTIS